jgi:hypothetical protein
VEGRCNKGTGPAQRAARWASSDTAQPYSSYSQFNTFPVLQFSVVVKHPGAGAAWVGALLVFWTVVI